jgi:hypothetical protein
LENGQNIIEIAILIFFDIQTLLVGISVRNVVVHRVVLKRKKFGTKVKEKRGKNLLMTRNISVTDVAK